MTFINKIQVGIDMQDVDRPAPFKRLHHRRMNRVVTTQHHRHSALLKHLAHRQLNVGVAASHVGMDDVGVARVNHAHLLSGEVHHIVFKVIGAGVAKREQGRRLADAARPKARTRAPLGSHVVGRT